MSGVGALEIPTTTTNTKSFEELLIFYLNETGKRNYSKTQYLLSLDEMD